MLANPLTLLRSLPRVVRVLIFGTLVNRLGSFIFPFLSLVLSREFGLPTVQVAGLVMAYGVGSLVSIMLGGVLTDTLGRRRTMLVSLFGSGSVAVVLGLAPSVKVFIPLLVCLAFLTDLYRPASSALISDSLPSSERGLGYAALRMAMNLGFFVGMGVGGVLVDWNWRVMFVADGLTTLACGAVIFRYVTETRPQPLSAEISALPMTPVRSGPTNPWRDRTFLLLCLSTLLFAVTVFADFTVLPLTVIRTAGYPAWVFGLITGLNGLLIAVFEVSATAALRGFRRLRLAAVGALVAGVGFAVTGLVMHWVCFVIAVTLWTAGEILMAPQQMSFAADWSPPVARGRYLAMINATWSLGAAISPALLLPLHAYLGERLFWPLLFVLNLPAAVLLWRLDRTADQPERLRGHAA